MRPNSLRGTWTIVALMAAIVSSTAPLAFATTTRGDFDRPPFYHGKPPAPAKPAAFVPITFRDEPGSLDPTPKSSPALAALLDSLGAELDRMGVAVALRLGAEPLTQVPRIRFGCRRGGTLADGTPLATDEIDTREPRRMAFDIDDPGRAWRDRVKQAAGDSIRAVLVIQLGFSEQWVRQTNWKGSKSIELGTHRSMPIEWLTSLESPVQVLQLTGAVITPAGKMVRVGAEGLLAQRTGMAASTVGAQEILTEEDLATLSAPDAGGTAVWRAALKDLVSGLLGEAAR